MRSREVFKNSNLPADTTCQENQKMPQTITLTVNNQTHTLTLDPDTPLLYVLRNNPVLK